MRGVPRRAGGSGAALLAAVLLAGTAVAADLPITLTDVASGSEVQLGLDGGRALHLVFLATWCETCLDELDALSDMEARWGADDYHLALVAVPTRQDLDRLREFAGRKHPPGRLLWDRDGSAVRALGIESLPTHVVFDARGGVAYQGPSLRDGATKALGELMRHAPRTESPR